MAASLASGNVELRWNMIATLPPVWLYSPKQHDNFAMNVESIAYRNATEMIIGLRSPLDGTTTEQLSLSQRRGRGNALYYLVSSVAAFLPTPGAPNPEGWTRDVPAAGVTGPFILNLNGQGFRSIEWVPDLVASGVGRFLIIGGNPNGGPRDEEEFNQIFSLWSWQGPGGPAPIVVIPDLRPYAVRPEGFAIIQVGGQLRILFVEDRFREIGYATRNAIHWPMSILGDLNNL